MVELVLVAMVMMLVYANMTKESIKVGLEHEIAELRDQMRLQIEAKDSIISE